MKETARAAKVFLAGNDVRLELQGCYLSCLTCNLIAEEETDRGTDCWPDVAGFFVFDKDLSLTDRCVYNTFTSTTILRILTVGDGP
ncbi:hypothetical protein KSB_32560 [Ktedonobacter robiniae]|uniref:Uncharacterized protein n=1 Tax=Ktedonobacter robiniae TaxID=2778365 RepID=A0ABQ3UQ22_9CHLR|nr:hypothetical protein KSB_32560 [Ktedonobacter robiniae]